MRISSKFRDYYDFVADMYGGGDPRVTYPRTRLTKVDPKAPWAGGLYIDFDKWGVLPDPNRHYNFGRLDAFEFRYLIIAGKPYLLRRSLSQIYDGDINSFKVADPEPDRYGGVSWQRDKFEFGVEYPYLVELCRKVKHPVFVINRIEYLKDRKVSIHVDGQCPVLGRIGMAKRVEPTQMYQELAMFVGNKMRETPDQKPPIELGNSQKIVKAGFDLKKSFRHRV